MQTVNDLTYRALSVISKMFVRSLVYPISTAFQLSLIHGVLILSTTCIAEDSLFVMLSQALNL